jgi:predicted nucleotidyltransferase
MTNDLYELSVFGSVLRADFGPESDINLLAPSSVFASAMA